MTNSAATFDPFATDLPQSQWPTNEAPVVSRVDKIADRVRNRLTPTELRELVDVLSWELQSNDAEWIAHMESRAEVAANCPW